MSRWKCLSGVKVRGLTPEVHWKWHFLNFGEGSGIFGVEVKFVEISEEYWW